MPSASSTLREWYEESFTVLFHADARPATLVEYQCTISRWEALTTNPPLAEIDQLTLARFLAGMSCSAATRAKHTRHVNHLLAKAGPAGPHNRDAVGLLNNPPWVRPPRCEQRLPSVPHDDLVSQFAARAPADLALFAVVAATTGSRQAAVRSLTDDQVDLANGVARFAAVTDKRRGERLKPLPGTTVAWWRLGIDRTRWRVRTDSFSARWKRWATKVGTPTLRPHGLKRWWAARLIRAGASPWAVRYALDHAQRDVTGIHYLAPFDELAGLVDRIELPPAMKERLACLRTTNQNDTSTNGDAASCSSRSTNTSYPTG